jgi:hypothetical protein
MPVKEEHESSSAIPSEMRTRIEKLAAALLERYEIVAPPVPIDHMLKDPLLDLWHIDPTQMSSSFGHGIFRHAPRLAEARLLYRAISESVKARRAGLDAPWPASRREVKYFARCVLMPEAWIRAMPDDERVIDAVSDKFHVPPFDAIVRLAELGLPVPDSSRTKSGR